MLCFDDMMVLRSDENDKYSNTGGHLICATKLCNKCCR